MEILGFLRLIEPGITQFDSVIAAMERLREALLKASREGHIAPTRLLRSLQPLSPLLCE